MPEEYNKTVLDHFHNPRNVGALPDASAVGTVKNPLCGDVVRLFLRVEEDRVVQARAKTYGCAAAIASSSMLTEIITGKPIDDLKDVTNATVVAALGGLPEQKIRCSVLAEEAIRAALKDYYSKSAPVKSH